MWVIIMYVIIYIYNLISFCNNPMRRGGIILILQIRKVRLQGVKWLVLVANGQ